MLQEDLKNVEKLSQVLEECQIAEKTPPSIVISETCDATLLAKFPKPKNKIPPVFLHKPVKFSPHMRKVLNLGIQFYPPMVGHHYTKLSCHTFEDQKALMQYFENEQLPYHTYGHPQNRKMKLVFKGLPKDVDINSLIEELKSVSIPIVRAHIMQTIKHNVKEYPLLVLAVVPNNNEGRRILQVQKLLGHDIQIEPLQHKPMQCFRCQKWGHSQRYCHGHFKCVKCAGDHFYIKCSKDPAKQPKCANCSSYHTANYKLCPYSPKSPEYINKRKKAINSKSMFPSACVTKELVTIENLHLFMRGRI